MAAASISEEKTTRPPKRSVSMPMGMRASEPRSTGTATSNAVCVAVNANRARNLGAKALISPQAAKQTVNEIVASARCCRADFTACSVIPVILIPWPRQFTKKDTGAMHPGRVAGSSCNPCRNQKLGDSLRLRVFVVTARPNPPRRHEDAKNHEEFYGGYGGDGMALFDRFVM